MVGQIIGNVIILTRFQILEVGEGMWRPWYVLLRQLCHCRSPLRRFSELFGSTPQEHSSMHQPDNPPRP